jgi:Icc-related predicted phosphoesterase
VKILVVADKVEDYIYSPGLKDRMPDVDLVLSCGDLPFYYLEFIVSSLNVPLLYVFGNHNTYEYRRSGESGRDDLDNVVGSMFSVAETSHTRQIKWEPEGCVNLDGRVARHNGLVIGGLEGSIRYRPDASHQYTEGQMRLKVVRLSLRLILARLRWGRPLDILITHSPPYRIHDGQDLAHRGFKAFLTFMDRFRPRYLIHGHRHVYHLQRPEVTQYAQTTVINVYGHSLMEVEPSDG